VSGTTGQNFDTLVTTGSSPWEQDVTLDGWFLYNSALADIADYNASNGDTNTGHFYSFGLVDAPERALCGSGSGAGYFGSPASGAIAGWIAFAATNTGGTLNRSRSVSTESNGAMVEILAQAMVSVSFGATCRCGHMDRSRRL
jgi:hypothetical protein